MNNKKIKSLIFTAIAAVTVSCATIDGEEKLVKGAQFIDRFLPLPKGEISSTCWGADNVIPRNIENGLENSEYSYWGGNIVIGDDGKYHMFVACWPENISRPNGKSGHTLWWASDVAHAVSDTPTGPYKVKELIGKGHNPEIYRLNDGSYVVGVMGEKAYTSKSLDGPWTQITTKFNFIDKEQNRTNRTYIVEKDSVYMMNKEGVIFSCKDGIENFVQVTDQRAYYRKNGSHEEDPVIWKDEICYNLVVNECLGRKAFHLTSKDGGKWEYEDGLAYTPNIVINEDGTKENWWKLERPKILTDKYGRPTHMNFAAVDTLKAEDIANDNHSSKNLVIPLRIARRLELESKSKESFTIKLLAEEGFLPNKEVDIKSLHFGNSGLVNYGHGAEVVKSKRSGDDLLLTFNISEMNLTPDDYKAKLLGKLKNGEPIWGYIRID